MQPTSAKNQLPIKRLYCAGHGAQFCYVMAFNKEEAAGLLNAPSAHYPTAEELRRIWIEARLHELTTEELHRTFGITRQALSLWRQKAGADLPTFRQTQINDARKRAADALGAGKGISELTRELRVSAPTIRAVAAEQGIEIPRKVNKKPPDDEIVKLAHGKTWRQLAAICKVALPTLQTHVYARPELATQLRQVMVRETTGSKAHGKVDVKKLIELRKAGKSAYAIAKELGFQTQTSIHWLKKLGMYK